MLALWKVNVSQCSDARGDIRGVLLVLRGVILALLRVRGVLLVLRGVLLVLRGHLRRIWMIRSRRRIPQ